MNKITGLVVANHEAVHELLLQLLNNGLKIPEKLSIICVEDSPLIEFWNPAITVVDIQPTFIAKTAFDSLLSQRSKNISSDATKNNISLIKILPKLINRASTRKI
jgi:LacI family transcriptional regulator